MSDARMRGYIKAWLDANVHGGADRTGTTLDLVEFMPDELQKVVEDCYEYVLARLAAGPESPQETK